MMRSMYTAVSGLRTHQGKMDTIGNNIANVNTVGFKRGQVTFKDAFSQTMTGASAPHGGKGGTNPVQIGMGVSLGSINTIHTVGNGQKTDNPTDLMINGEGFFTVSDDVNFNNKFYTRAGNFSLDRDGNLVTQDGFKVLGYGVKTDSLGNTVIDDSNVKGIRVNKSDTVPASSTEHAQFRGNLNANMEIGDKATMDTVIYDSLGNEYKLTFEIEKKEVADDKTATWELKLNRVTDASNGNYAEGDKITGVFPADYQIEFDANGKIIQPANSFEITGLGAIEFDKDKNNEAIKDKDGNEVTLKPKGEFKTIKFIDKDKDETYDKITQYANETDLKPYRGDGNTSGTLDGFAIDATGTVMGIFTNGERKAIGQLMLTKFDNPMGLEKMGNNLFTNTRNSGEPQNGTGGGRGFGAIDGGTLEMSNVDISLEFTEMITTQRGFQANSRIITTSDEMLQELVNIKR